MIKELVPSSLRLDDKSMAIIESTEDSLKNLYDYIQSLLIIPNIDSAPSSILDSLAWQFHLEGYELAQTDEQKRTMIKKAVELHRYKGTKYAVKGVLSALGINGEISEWFEYEGEPYRFKIYLESCLSSNDDYKKMLSLVDEYKNERSWLDSIGIHREYTENVFISSAIKSGNNYSIDIRCTINIDKNIFNIGCAQREGITQTIGVSSVIISLQDSIINTGFAFRQAKNLTIGVKNG